MLDVAALDVPKKQAEILIAASGLFQQFGIKRVTVEEICQTAAVSKMTFYKYYKNKDELVKFIWDKGFEQAFQKFDQIREMNIPFGQKLELMLQLKEDYATKFSYQLALEYFYATAELKGFFEQLASTSLNHFLEFIKESQEKGEVRADLNPQFLLTILNNIKYLVKDEALINQYPSYKDFVLEVNNFIYYGILPRPDAKKS